ncbi:MAG: hypothetical protein JJE22_12610, partial [Bacteroidia bacterium]|nr:hypothetical protein [Bacteroidia bacterium]
MKTNNSYITRGTALFTIAIGCLVLLGWFSDIPAFRSILPGSISMKFNTAVCFILSGITLYLLDLPAGNQVRKTVVVTCSWIILFAGLLSFSQYIFGWNLGIDGLLWKDISNDITTAFPGRMSLITSINFSLLGSAFILLERKRYYWLIQALLIAILPGALGVIINYIYGVSFLNLVPLFANTSFPTAILFILLFIGAFISPA